MGKPKIPVSAADPGGRDYLLKTLERYQVTSTAIPDAAADLIRPALTAMSTQAREGLSYFSSARGSPGHDVGTRWTSRMMRVLSVIGLLVLLLTGCGKRYWHKTGSGYDEFARDHRACANESALQATATREYGIVSLELYRRCLTSRGWTREQKPDPVPLNWFRGIEDDDLVQLDAVPTQDWEKPGYWFGR